MQEAIPVSSALYISKELSYFSRSLEKVSDPGVHARESQIV
jgi:hypothetical protein